MAFLEKQREGLIRENQQLKHELEENFLYQQTLNDEYQATFLEQSSLLEKRQVYIDKLEMKVQDLMEDVKGFFSLDSHRLRLPSQVCTPLSRSFSLKLLNDLKATAFKLENFCEAFLRGKGEERFSAHPYSLECRQIFSSLREESSGLVFIYCSRTSSVIFAHPLFKEWTGYHGGDFFAQREKIIVSSDSRFVDDACLKQGPHHGQMIVQTKHSGKRTFHYAVLILNKGVFYHHHLGLLHPMSFDNR